MRIFITGGSGFIGKRLMDAMLIKERDVEAMYNFDLTEGEDIRDLAALDRAIDYFKPDVIVHLAALAGVRRGEAYPGEYISTNVTGTYNVLSMAKKHKVNRVVIFSSSCVFNEAGELDPRSVYGLTKLFTERLAVSFKESIRDIYVVRPFTVYGENGRGDQVMATWDRQIRSGKPVTFFGDGKSFRPYTYVGDVCNAVGRMILGESHGFQVFNLAGNQKVTLERLYQIFENHWRKREVRIEREELPMPATDDNGKVPADTSNWDLIGFKSEDFESRVLQILESGRV